MRTTQYPSHTTAMCRLQTLSERIARSVCSIAASAPSRAEIAEVDALRTALGLDWDAINKRWRAWTPEEK